MIAAGKRVHRANRRGHSNRMAELDATLGHLAPGVLACGDLAGTYNPRHGLAIYCLPAPDLSLSSPSVVLGEALAAKSGLGCTLLEGIPEVVPEGAVVVGGYSALRAIRPDLTAGMPEPSGPQEYSIKLSRSAVIASPSGEGLAGAMQTLAMLLLRYGEEPIPGCVLTDRPAFQGRGIAVELETGEISTPLLMQIASFAATFKANAIHLILQDDFEASREIPGIASFAQSCQSFGIRLGVRLPLLAPLLTGKRTPAQVWAAVRAAARAFQATEAGLDDPCPEEANAAACARVIDSLSKGGSGLKRFCLDAEVIARSGAGVSALRAAGIYGTHRWDGGSGAPGAGLDAIPLIMDVSAPLSGFAPGLNAEYHRRLDSAAGAARVRDRKELFVAFRNVGVSHMWQNMLYPAATGFIVGWGLPATADEAAWRYSNLLYGDAAREVMRMWDIVAAAFPAGLDGEGERLVRRTAFGRWPETEEEFALLAGIDWAGVAGRIREAVDALKDTAAGLTRNSMTLSGARLALYALSWLHCFVALEPELEHRRKTGFDEDGRTEPIAKELYNNFAAWHAHLKSAYAESGLEFSEMGMLESMGLRLKGLCDGIMDYTEG